MKKEWLIIDFQIIIGRGGDTIKQINQQSGAHCEMDRKTQGNGTEKSFNINKITV